MAGDAGGGWVYWRSESQLWTVGYYRPDGTRETASDHETAGAAAARVAYLNGLSVPAALETVDPFVLVTIGTRFSRLNVSQVVLVQWQGDRIRASLANGQLVELLNTPAHRRIFGIPEPDAQGSPS